MLRPLGCLSLALLAASCGGGSRETTAGDGAEPVEYRSDRAYLRLPGFLTGGEVEARAEPPALLHCYEADAAPPESLTYVQLELVFEGGGLRPRFGQQQQDLSDQFTSCVERVVLEWDLEPEIADEGEIVPIEFGPLE